MSDAMQQNDDGSWSPTTPLSPQGMTARAAFWLRRKGFRRLSMVLARWDERRLG